MRELLVRLEQKRLNYRKRVMARFPDLDRRFLGVSVLLFVISFLAPASIPWMSGEIVGLALIGFALALTAIMLPVGIVFL